MKKVYVIGGGTTSPVKTHLSLCAEAYGGTARRMSQMFRERLGEPGEEGYMEVRTVLTKMADSTSNIKTNGDVRRFLDDIVGDFETQIVVLNAALCDFSSAGVYHLPGDAGFNEDIGFKEAQESRLDSSCDDYFVSLNPAKKVVSSVRQKRKDILLVAFKTTDGATEQEQYLAGLKLLKTASCNLVLANDVGTGLNMVITPEEARYHVTRDRNEALTGLVEMALLRSHLKFTRSTVVSADSVPWEDGRVPANLRAVVDHCVAQGAYKPFMGATVGHFAVKVSETEFLTSRRKTNFNRLQETGLVRVVTDGPDSVIAYGSKPSVGGQSQRIVFSEHEGMDCIVHFHCPLKEFAVDDVPIRSQREYECGSHECGQNTSNGLAQFGFLKAVMLDNHGPNIVFSKETDPAEVIAFIERNFDLTAKTGGLV
jgi:hypothetical protein